MDVYFWKFSKRENSTAVPDTIGDLFECTLKTAVTLTNPVIVLGLGTQRNPIEYNYAYIEDFGRYYFVTDWTANGPIWSASLAVDVLATYRDEIGSSTQYILRCSATSDGSVMDSMYPTTTTTIHEDQVDVPWGTTLADGEYVLGIVNDDSSAVGSVSYYALAPTNMGTFKSKLMDADSLFDGMDWGDFTQDYVKALCNPMQYITSAKWYPFSVPSTGGAGRSDIKCGWWDVSTVWSRVNADATKEITFTLPITKHPQAATRGTFLNLSPYTSYQLTIQPFGSFPIDTTQVQSVTEISCVVNVDCITGVGTLRVYASGATLMMATCQFGVPICLAQVSTDMPGQFKSYGNALASAATGNVLGAASGIMSTVSASVPQVSTSGANGTLAGLIYPPRIVATYHHVADEDNTHRGRPLMSDRIINTIPGYIVCADGDMQLPSTAEENSRIKSYLEGGFFYE